MPTYYIVPSKVVARYVKKTHQDWINTLGNGRKRRKDAFMRMFHDSSDECLNKWGLLGLS